MHVYTTESNNSNNKVPLTCTTIILYGRQPKSPSLRFQQRSKDAGKESNGTKNRLHFTSNSDAKTRGKATKGSAYASPYWQSPDTGRKGARATTDKQQCYTLTTTHLSGETESEKQTRPSDDSILKQQHKSSNSKRRVTNIIHFRITSKVTKLETHEV